MHINLSCIISAIFNSVKGQLGAGLIGAGGADGQRNIRTRHGSLRGLRQCGADVAEQAGRNGPAHALDIQNFSGLNAGHEGEHHHPAAIQRGADIGGSALAPAGEQRDAAGIDRHPALAPAAPIAGDGQAPEQAGAIFTFEKERPSTRRHLLWRHPQPHRLAACARDAVEAAGDRQVFSPARGNGAAAIQ